MRFIVFLNALFFLSLCQCILFHPPHQQTPAVNLPFDESLFAARCSLAAEFANDDLAAWWTSDSIAAEKPPQLDSIDTIWFVHRGANERSVFYGRYDTTRNTYCPKYVFSFSKDSTVTRKTPAINDSIVPFARAVAAASFRFQTILDSFMLDFKFNHYIRRNADRTFSIWYFPAGADRYCAYGLEIMLHLDSSASSVINQQISGNELKYFEVQKAPYDITLDNTFDNVPSVGNIFFVYLFGRYFGAITINNCSSTTIAHVSPDGRSCSWTQKKYSGTIP